MKHLSDQELMRIVQAGDFSPASEIYDRYSARSYNFAFRFLRNSDAAEDAVQEVFVKMLKHANHVGLYSEELNPATGEFLGNHPQAFTHIALINFNNNPVDFNHLRKKMQAEYLLMFGMNALQIQLPFTMPDYQVQQYDNCKIVTAPSLNDLNKKTPVAKTEKTKLWKSLQNIFSL